LAQFLKSLVKSVASTLQTDSRDTKAEVLAATDIVDVISSYIEVKPAGSGRFKALCPFHHEKTPSFHVNRERQTYHCFGCGKGGDVFTFLMEYESLSFREALRRLADKAGIALPAFSPSDNRDEFNRQKLLELGTFAMRLYRDIYDDAMKGSKARAYVKQRTLRPETVKRFAMGYAPMGWDTLLGAAIPKGFREEILELSGLVRRGNRGLYDFFHDRLMFPIRDVAGNVVAFGGRDLSGEAPGKYVNTPENPVYKKSRVLYGLHEARDALRREQRALLVEGYFDLIRCFDSGIENVVASCGTALTTEQAALIRRYVPEVVVVYDGDAAGIRAALRGVGILNATGLTVRALTLPSGQDPDDYVKANGPDAFRALVDGAQDFVAFYIDMNHERTGSIEGRSEVAGELFAILRDLNDEIRRDEYLKQMARALRVDEWTLRREFQKSTREQGSRIVVHREEPKEAAAVTISLDDYTFVAVLLNHEPLLQRAKTALEGVELGQGATAEVLRQLFENPGPDLTQRLESEAAVNLYTAAANRSVEWDEKAEGMVGKRINRFKREAWLAESERVKEAIRDAERLKDIPRVIELMSRKSQLDKDIQGIGDT
jgi:DNA primase